MSRRFVEHLIFAREKETFDRIEEALKQPRGAGKISQIICNLKDGYLFLHGMMVYTTLSDLCYRYPVMAQMYAKKVMTLEDARSWEKLSDRPIDPKFKAWMEANLS